MKKTVVFSLCLLMLIVFSCSHVNKIEKCATAVKDSLPEHFARLEVPATLDIGQFSEFSPLMSTTILIKNSGNDTLYVLGVVPECDCTELTLLDSIIPPCSSGRVQVKQDLSLYPADTIRKDFSIISNSYDERVRRVTLIATPQK